MTLDNGCCETRTFELTDRWNHTNIHKVPKIGTLDYLLLKEFSVPCLFSLSPSYVFFWFSLLICLVFFLLLSRSFLLFRALNVISSLAGSALQFNSMTGHRERFIQSYHSGTLCGKSHIFILVQHSKGCSPIHWKGVSKHMFVWLCGFITL